MIKIHNFDTLNGHKIDNWFVDEAISESDVYRILFARLSTSYQNYPMIEVEIDRNVGTDGNVLLRTFFYATPNTIRSQWTTVIHMYQLKSYKLFTVELDTIVHHLTQK